MQLNQAVEGRRLLGDLAEVGRVRVLVRRRELRTVLKIDRVDPQLQRDAFAEPELALKIHVPLVGHVRPHTVNVLGEDAAVEGGRAPGGVALETLSIEPAVERAVHVQDVVRVAVVEVIAQFKCSTTQWSPMTLMLLDTGASVSLLPLELLERLEINPVTCFEHSFTGVMQKTECKVPAKICRLSMRLEDEQGSISPEWEGLAAFTAVKPLIPLLGMKDCLEHFNMAWDMEAGQVVLKWAKSKLD